LDDQPASAIPYTPIELMASTNRKPIGTSATTMGIGPWWTKRPSGPRVTSKSSGSGAAKGITAERSRAGMNDMAGASWNSQRLASAGAVSSLRMFFTPSAAGCSRPPQPTRLGPNRFCIHALTLRSMSVSSATPTITTVKTNSILMMLSSRNPFISGVMARPFRRPRGPVRPRPRALGR